MSVVALRRASLKVPSWPVVLRLARREGIRMVRHPLMFVGALLSLAMFGLLTWQTAPVLHRDDTSILGALLPFAAATLIVANLAASRAARHGTNELYEGTATSAAARTTGHLLSLLFAAGASFMVVAVMFAYMFLDDPIGMPRFGELFAGPAVVALLGAVGIALGRWRSHPALGPMAVVVVIALQTLLIQPVVGVQATVEGVASRSAWFAPWVPMSLTTEVPPELVIRPSAWHLLYIVGLTLLFGALAIGRHGVGRRVIALTIAGLAGVVIGSVGQLTPPGPSQKAALAALVENPEDHQVCEERSGVTYCAYPAYAPWIDRWAKPIEGALEHIPEDARPEGIVVRQTFGSYFEGPVDLPAETIREIERAHRRSLRAPADVLVDDEGRPTVPTFWVGPHWGRGEAEGLYEVGLALFVAMEAVDLPSSRAEITLTPVDVALLKEKMIPTVPKRHRERAERRLVVGRRWSSCYTSGQARAVVAWWIAGEATPATRAALRQVAGEFPYGLSFYEFQGDRIATYLGPFVPLYPLAPPPMWDRVFLGSGEFHYAARLLERPAEEIETAVTERWDEVIAPTSRTETFITQLNVSPHPTIEEQIAALPDDVRLEGGAPIDSTDTYLNGVIPCV